MGPRRATPVKPWSEPACNFGGQMADRISGIEVNPYLRSLLVGGIGNETDGVADIQSLQVLIPAREHRPVDRRPEMPRLILRKWWSIGPHEPPKDRGAGHGAMRHGTSAKLGRSILMRNGCTTRIRSE